MEHRCGSRRVVNVVVTIRTPAGLVGKGTVCEVSASGARLLCALPIPLDSSVSVQFTIEHRSGSRKRETIEAEVVRRTEGGYAVEWREFAPVAARSVYQAANESPSEEAPRQPQSQALSRKA